MAAPTSGTEPKKTVSGATQKHRFPAIWPGALGTLLLFLAVPKMPSEYYDYVLPVSVVGLSAVMVLLAVACRRWVWVLPFVRLSSFFNPIHRPGLGSVFEWQLADVVGALLFLVGAYFIYPKPKAPEKAPASQSPVATSPGGP
jgi:hypothetical protein